MYGAKGHVHNFLKSYLSIKLNQPLQLDSVLTRKSESGYYSNTKILIYGVSRVRVFLDHYYFKCISTTFREQIHILRCYLQMSILLFQILIVRMTLMIRCLTCIFNWLKLDNLRIRYIMSFK